MCCGDEKIFDDLFFSYFLEHRNTPWKNYTLVDVQIHGMNAISEDLTPCAFVLRSYNRFYKCM